MMLTSDVALLNDPMYLDIVNEFAGDSTALDESFAAACHKLTTSAFGNDDNARCTGAAPYVASPTKDAAAPSEEAATASTSAASGLLPSCMMGFLLAVSVLALN
mmetsp:Transcript_26063/g.52367  ORF Transcript_26063/g.52367 Transcript_26063/m.52367 type:complete len:104 (-) Transcript_26063:67-378(-)